MSTNSRWAFPSGFSRLMVSAPYWPPWEGGGGAERDRFQSYPTRFRAASSLPPLPPAPPHNGVHVEDDAAALLVGPVHLADADAVGVEDEVVEVQLDVVLAGVVAVRLHGAPAEHGVDHVALDRSIGGEKTWLSCY